MSLCIRAGVVAVALCVAACHGSERLPPKQGGDWDGIYLRCTDGEAVLYDGEASNVWHREGGVVFRNSVGLQSSVYGATCQEYRK